MGNFHKPTSSPNKFIKDIHQRTIEDITGSLPYKPKIFIHAGRGIGKSTVLTEIAERQESGNKATLIDGRRWRTSPAEIKAAEAIYSSIFLDDIDHVLSMTGLMAKDSFQEVIRTIIEAAATLLDRGHNFVVTSTLSPISLLDLIQQYNPNDRLREEAYSLFTQDFIDQPLDPWAGDWERDLASITRRHLRSIGEDQLRICQETILELSGGHPALFSWALFEVADIVSDRRSSGADQLRELLLQNQRVATPALRTLLTSHLEDYLLRTGLKRLLVSVRDLQESEHVGKRQAYDWLISIAKGTADTPPLKAREILRDEGLIYRDNASYIIPGTLLPRVILQAAEGSKRLNDHLNEPQMEPSSLRELKIEPDSIAPGLRGKLVMGSGNTRLEVALSGGPWVILDKLFERPDHVFSLRELVLPPLTSEPAAQSAMQRLQSKLRQAGVLGVVENVYGKGYRKGTAPALHSATRSS